MDLYIIRHGETRLNVGKCLQGWIDEPLNENGRELAAVTGRGLKDIRFDAAFSSPLKRAYDTAKLLLDENEVSGRIEIKTDDRLKELSWGSWDGLGCGADNYELPIDNFNDFYDKPYEFSGAQDAETIPELVERLKSFYDELVNNRELADSTVLISTHGCAMRALLHQVYEDREDFWHGRVPYNCAVNIVEVDGSGEGKLIGDDVIYYDKALIKDNYKKV